ncbi:MAG: hypothetical protein NTX75_08735 [Proteobacteria bacterium]|nr:hypothetical protein [Pseudomonadota bacterium]
MGFIVFAILGIVFVVAFGISGTMAGFGWLMFRRNSRAREDTKRVFYTVLTVTIIILYTIVTFWPFPQGRPGSNYSEWLNVWGTKIAIYTGTPGIGSLLGGLFTFFCRKKEGKG